MATQWSMERAARCWCDEATKDTTMDSELAKVFAEALDQTRRGIDLTVDGDKPIPGIDAEDVVLAECPGPVVFGDIQSLPNVRTLTVRRE